ncbi:sulfatase [Sphingobacterium sp. UT-1RO-CII-1]|uniref:sulfatase n=1 Tax=Sphingobacterium sp. UT-1RO-CII-1 TaxID=2995225 RepID=UPI00227D5E04|nr:sulfatase [Sphingobacterium sp. UT-1RO-CII-1]MCY4780113.1 sulfatase [Sphingobacterium sp. UT-1RO-CII-1]
MSAQIDSETKGKPNILLILVDDLKPAIGAYGDKTAITPYMDKLAANGLRFDFAYSNQAVCAPSRFNLMLGSRSSSTGIYGFGQNFRDYYPQALTMPEFFKTNGYHTEGMGKVYHIGHGTYQDEASWTVPHHPELLIEYVDAASKKDGFTREEALFSNKSAEGLPRGVAWESPDVPDDAYADGRIANRAVKRLKELADMQKNPNSQPFFLAVGFARPHLPFSVPQKYWDKYNPATLPLPEYEEKPVGAPSYAVKRDTEIDQYFPIPHSSEQDPFPKELQRKLIHGYYASVSYVDAQIGKVMHALKESGLNDNTIVVLWGDHGYHLGEMGIWTKHVNYELANHIPLIISAPGVNAANSSTSQLTESVDIYPTLVELAGFALPEVEQPFDGISMLPVLRDTTVRLRDHAYHSFPREGRLGRAIRTDRYRLVEWKKINEPDAPIDYELYDYSEGKVEKKNIASERSDILEKMKSILANHPDAK